MISMHINLEETAPLSHKIHLLGQCILISLQYTIASKMWYIYIFFYSAFVIFDYDYSAITTPEKVPET